MDDVQAAADASAGVVVSLYGLAQAYVINAVTCPAVILSLSLLNVADKEGGDGSASHYLVELVDGLRYTLAYSQMREAILLTGVSAYFGRGILDADAGFAAPAGAPVKIVDASLTSIGFAVGCLLLAALLTNRTFRYDPRSVSWSP